MFGLKKFYEASHHELKCGRKITNQQICELQAYQLMHNTASLGVRWKAIVIDLQVLSREEKQINSNQGHMTELPRPFTGDQCGSKEAACNLDYGVNCVTEFQRNGLT